MCCVVRRDFTFGFCTVLPFTQRTLSDKKFSVNDLMKTLRRRTRINTKIFVQLYASHSVNYSPQCGWQCVGMDAFKKWDNRWKQRYTFSTSFNTTHKNLFSFFLNFKMSIDAQKHVLDKANSYLYIIQVLQQASYTPRETNKNLNMCSMCKVQAWRRNYQ